MRFMVIYVLGGMGWTAGIKLIRGTNVFKNGDFLFATGIICSSYFGWRQLDMSR